MRAVVVGNRLCSSIQLQNGNEPKLFQAWLKAREVEEKRISKQCRVAKYINGR
jgi:hypothetical protein